MKSINNDFNVQSQEALKKVISRLSGLTESLKEQNINLLEQKNIHIFGYGSLVTQPHEQENLSEITPAYLWGYSRDMYCKSIASGTHKKTGLTLGLDKKDGSITPGAILSYDNSKPENLINMLNKFADREVVTGLKIYKFEFLEVEKEDGTKVHAIACIADPEEIMGYAGDLLTKFDKESLPQDVLSELSLRKKANEIAWANGTFKKSGNHATGKSYFDRFVRLPIQSKLITTKPDSSDKRNFALYKEQERMLRLGRYIDDERNNMRKNIPEYVQALEKRESEQLAQWKKGNAYKQLQAQKPVNTAHKRR